MAKETKAHWMGVPELADYYSLSTKTIYRDVRSGKLPSSRIGGGLIRVNPAQRAHYENAKK